MASPVRRVWGVGTFRTLRAHWMLRELELPYETRAIHTRTPEMNDPEFVAVSERGKIPILEDGEVVIGESAAIVLYLGETYRESISLVPEVGDPTRVYLNELLFYTMAELEAPLYTVRMHGGLPEIYGEAPTAVAAARDYFTRQAGEIERRLADGRPYLIGEPFSAADLVLAPTLTWAKWIEIPLPASLEAYLTRCTERPAYEPAFKHNLQS